MVTVDAAARTNSVTVSEGIKLDALLFNSFSSAPFRDYIKSTLAMVPVDWEDSVPQCSGTDSKHPVSHHDDNADPVHHQGYP
jgi:hypothetical protein